MRALFSRAEDRRFRRSLALLGLGPVLVVIALMGWVRRPAATGQGQLVPQPVPFDHRLHVRGLGVDCRYCHSGAERSPHAGLPPTEACVPCHNPTWFASAVFAPVRASLASGTPIPWRRVHTLPDFVFFDHRIHVTQGIGCERCHGRVEEMDRVRQVAPLTMTWCLDCHRQPARATRAANDTGTASRRSLRSITDCSGCHR